MKTLSDRWTPQHPVALIAGTPLGGGQDRPARVLSKVLADERLLEVPVHVINIVGKGGGKAWDYLLEHAADPHVLAISSPPLLTNPLVGESDYDHAALTPIANLYTEYVAFVARADSAITSAAELLQRLGKDPGSVTVSLATALGTTNHIALARVTMQAGGDVRAAAIRVFDSARYAVEDVVAGHAEVAAVTAVSAAPEIAEGKLRPLAVSAPERLGGLFAGTPTFQELSIDCIEGTWRGVLAPAGISDAQSAFWEHLLRTATRSADWRAELSRQYWVDCFMDAAACRSFLDQERANLRATMTRLGLVA
jgi:putative tricarboxylic transport membrane protein